MHTESVTEGPASFGITSDPAFDWERPRRAPAINPADVDWPLVRTSTVLVQQHLRYEYPAPIRALNQTLMLIPPATFGSQRRTLYKLDVSMPCDLVTRPDAFLNTVVEVNVPVVEHAIEFEAWIAVERNSMFLPRSLPASWLSDARLLEPTERTLPDAMLTQAATELANRGMNGLELAELANDWVFRHMTYTRGVTNVRTTAAEAATSRAGVCQDYAHIMLSICRLMGLPSLYVSGHLLGEGGTHAWVEVLLPSGDGSEAEAWAFDPTHGRRVGSTYVSVAVGRDYRDVAPTSGSYRSRHIGNLSTRKQVKLTEVAYQ